MRGVLNFDRFFRTGPRWTIVERDPVVALQCGGRGWMTEAL